jgi:hypothetical protein
MEIIIRDTQAFRHHLEERNILWELFFKRTIKIYFIQYILGLLLLAIGLSPFNKEVSWK